MIIRPTRIFPLGDNAVTVEFGSEISVEFNDAALTLANYFTANPFTGFVEAVPTIASTTIFYRSHEIAAEITNDKPAFEHVKKRIIEAIENIPIDRSTDGRLISVPVSFLPHDALDLSAIADHCGLDANDIIDIFLSQEYRVFMLGFLPGFPYLGVIDERIATPRRSTPRVSVPKGSVGIAGRQTGIYPSNSPGGWQIIGRTDIDLFDPRVDPPCFFTPGDRVRFVRA